MVAEVSVPTATVATLNVALNLPLGTTTDWLTLTALADEESETTTPLPVAFLEIVTVPVADVPPTTETGNSETLVRLWPKAETARQRSTLEANVIRRRKRNPCCE